MTGHKTIHLLVPFLRGTALAFWDWGSRPPACATLRGNCVGRGPKQRPTSEEKADPAIRKEERRSLDAEPMAFAC